MLTVYTTENCAFCPMVKKYLQLKNVPYKEVDVTNDSKMRDELIKITGMLTVPVTTDGTNHVVGFNPAKLAQFTVK